MQSTNEPGRGVFGHDDYCRTVGQVVLDAHARVRSLEAQLASVTAGLRAEVERLLAENDRLRRTPPAPIRPAEG